MKSVSWTKAAAVFAMIVLAMVALPSHTLAEHGSPEHTLEAAHIAAMRAATQAFIATFDDTKRAVVAPRPGLAVAGKTGDLRKAFHAMLAAAFSSQAYFKTTTSI